MVTDPCAFNGPHSFEVTAIGMHMEFVLRSEDGL